MLTRSGFSIQILKTVKRLVCTICFFITFNAIKLRDHKVHLSKIWLYFFFVPKVFYGNFILLFYPAE